MLTLLPVPDEDFRETSSAYDIPDRIPYEIISGKLCKAMNANKDTIGNRILIPNHYNLFFNEKDRELRKHSEEIMIDELKKSMLKEAKRLNGELTTDELILEIFSDESLEKGKIRIQCYFLEQNPDQKQINSVSVEYGDDENNTISSEKICLADEKPDNDAPVDFEIFEKSDNQDFLERCVFGEEVTNHNSDASFKLEVYKEDELIYSKVLEDTAVIGRGDNSDIKLPDDDAVISRKHAVLKFCGDKAEIIPEGVNGTLLNNIELDLGKTAPVKVDDEIKIKDYLIKIRALNESHEPLHVINN
jgi:hypothetical protein